ncbi:tRNA 2-thiouridine(34) synthase MnmA [Chloroflexota bacterium]
MVAMSGGVDSSVAAAILQEEGYEVIGATMRLWPPDKPAYTPERPAERPDAIADAKMVADKLKISHHVWDFKETFAQQIVADFCRVYHQGKTPNPCVRCNRYIKFGALLKQSRELGADFLATGHHARIEGISREIYRLKKGTDPGKDQSYWLYAIDPAALPHILMPVGEMTKKRVRERAREIKLPVADRPESQEVCFIPDNNYRLFLKEYAPRALEPGPILNRQGDILGEHRGLLSYTIGQRKGLGLSFREPLFVTAIDREKNAIVVGSKEETYRRGLIASGLRWLAIDSLKEPIKLKARIRHRHEEAPAEISPLDSDRVGVRFASPQMAITPGQAVVFYDEDTVIGGGTIEAAEE